VRKADNLPPSCAVTKSGNLNFLEPSGPLRPCNGTALPLPLHYGGPGSSVGIATDYRLDGPGDRIPVGGETFRTCPDWPWGLPSLLYNGYHVFPGGKERPGRDTDPSPSSSVVVKKE